MSVKFQSEDIQLLLCMIKPGGWGDNETMLFNGGIRDTIKSITELEIIPVPILFTFFPKTIKTSSNFNNQIPVLDVQSPPSNTSVLNTDGEAPTNTTYPISNLQIQTNSSSTFEFSVECEEFSFLPLILDSINVLCNSDFEKARFAFFSMRDVYLNMKLEGYRKNTSDKQTHIDFTFSKKPNKAQSANKTLTETSVTSQATKLTEAEAKEIFGEAVVG